MMAALTFPTMAEQAVAEFLDATRTVSLATIAKRREADVSHRGFAPRVTVYTFDDDTSIEVTGRGPAHKATTHLP